MANYDSAWNCSADSGSDGSSEGSDANSQNVSHLFVYLFPTMQVLRVKSSFLQLTIGINIHLAWSRQSIKFEIF